MLPILLAGCSLFADVSGEEAQALVREGALLIDVRDPELFGKGHIEGAINVPFDDLPQWAGNVARRDRPVVVYCEIGILSYRAKGILLEAGFREVYNLGGMRRWD